MTYQLTTLYHHPDDPETFQHHYDNVHSVLTRALPGIKSLDVQLLGPGLDGSTPAYYQVAMVTFGSAEAAAEALASPEGEALLADLPTAAPSGAEIFAGDVTNRLRVSRVARRAP